MRYVALGFEIDDVLAGRQVVLLDFSVIGFAISGGVNGVLVMSDIIEYVEMARRRAAAHDALYIAVSGYAVRVF